MSVATHRCLQHGRHQGIDLGGRVQLDHSGRRVVPDLHVHPGEDRGTISIGEYDDDDRCLETDPVGHYHGYRFRTKGPVQVTEQINGLFLNGPEQRLSIGRATYRPHVQASVDGVRSTRGLYHPSVSDDHDGSQLPVGREVTLHRRVRGPLTCQGLVTIEVQLPDTGIAPDLLVGVRRVDRVQTIDGRAADRGEPIRSGKADRYIGGKGVQGGTSEPVQATSPRWEAVGAGGQVGGFVGFTLPP